MKDLIRSNSNFLIKEIRKLNKKKYRDVSDKFVVESRKLIDEAIISGYQIEHIFVREDVETIYFDFAPNFVDKKIFDNASKLVTPDGYMAIVKKKESSNIEDRVLILDEIQDPGNMGTLIRSAEAFGYTTIMAINSVDFYNEKVLRSSMGSIFRLNLVESSYEDISKLNDHVIYVADMDGRDYRDENYPDKMALVVGNEGNGISEEIENFAQATIKIPMQGMIESLNAAVSASIIMAESVNKK